MMRLTTAARIAFGAWMLIAGANHFLQLVPEPAGQTMLARQLMAALVHSRLIDVAMAVELAAGALVLARLFVPAALCAAMPISTCALYWAVLLNREPAGAALALAAFALNGLLMLAYLPAYSRILEPSALATGEARANGDRYDALYADPSGRSARGQFAGALIPLIAAAAFYLFVVPPIIGHWNLPVLLFPAFVLLARRLHDMARSGWWLVAPGLAVAAALWMRTVAPGDTAATVVSLAAAIVFAGFLLWGVIGRQTVGRGSRAAV